MDDAEKKNGEDFDFINMDFDEQIPAAIRHLTLIQIGCFYSTDADENPDPSLKIQRFILLQYSWFADAQGNTIAEMADNWFGMGPITVPDEGAELSFTTNQLVNGLMVMMFT